MKTKLIFAVMCLLVPLLGSAQVDMSILNKGIKDHVQNKIKVKKDSIEIEQHQIDSLKQLKEYKEMLKELDKQYEKDKNQIALSIDAKNNEIKIAQQNLENTKGVVSNKKIEFVGLFNQSDPVPNKDLKEINEKIVFLSTIPSSAEEEKIDKKVVVNERYNQNQKDSLISLTINYRRLENVLFQINQKIEEGNLFAEKIDGLIKNRKEFIANSQKIQQDYDIESSKKNRLINVEDSLISVHLQTIKDETKRYKDNKIKFVLIKDGILTPGEQSLFDQIEFMFFKEETDSISVTTDSVSSKYFKDQYNQLVKLNMELTKKKKQNGILLKKIDFIKGINTDLENTLQNVYGQERRNLETVEKEQQQIQQKLNNAKNGIFDDQSGEKQNIQKDQIKNEEQINTQPQKKKKRW